MGADSAGIFCIIFLFIHYNEIFFFYKKQKKTKKQKKQKNKKNKKQKTKNKKQKTKNKKIEPNLKIRLE
jgi:hypothetical protein